LVGLLGVWRAFATSATSVTPQPPAHGAADASSPRPPIPPAGGATVSVAPATSPPPPQPAVPSVAPPPQRAPLAVHAPPPAGRARLAPGGHATLRIQVEPWGSVRLDDRDLGLTPLRPVEVEPGRHTIRAAHPELGTRARSITVRAGEARLITID